ncbi:MAG: DNA primase family protein [Fimbriimonas sp.]
MPTDSRGCVESFTVSRFDRAADAEPKGDVWSIGKLADVLTTFRERPGKDGRLWSPTRFDGHRDKASALEICALVLDFDKGHAWEDFEAHWSRYAYAIHTSHSHTPGHPKWRAVFPFERPVAATPEHEEFWKALHAVFCDELGGGVAGHDEGEQVVDPLKDTARMYYLPACPPGAERFSTWHDGALLDWRDFEVAARTLVKTRADQAAAERSGGVKATSPGSGRAGDDFNLRGTWEEILEPKGWFKVGRRYGKMELWERPGQPKGPGHCARTGEGIVGDRFVNWSTDPSVSMLPPNRAFDKFGVYARLYHGGDLTAAARDLGAKGYGAPPVGGIPPGDPPGFSRSAPPPPVSRPESPATVEDQLELVENDDGDLEPEMLDVGSADYQPWTDLGNARRLMQRYPNQLRYCADWGRWLTWEGSRWHEDAPENPGARGYAHNLADGLYSRAKTRPLGKKLQNGRGITSMLREAQALPGINVRYHQLDTHEMLLAVRNGVIDLRTGKLIPPDPDLLITKGVDVEFDPEATCPVFDAFLIDIMQERKELVDLLLRALGYSLTGSTKEQKFFLLYGERGRNGKSTLMELMQKLLGDELCFTIRKKLLTDADADSARFSKALIEGKRMVYADETKKGARFDIEFIKEFAAGKKMEAERKGKDGYQFQLQAKLWYSVNSLPGADFDASFKDRLVPIPFEQSYYDVDNENYRDGDKPPDKDLDQKLRKELPGILNTLVRGCLRWQQMGGLGQPEQVRALKQQYEAENDSIADWIRDRCELGESGRVKQADAWLNYAEWAKQTRPTTAYRKRIEFKRALIKRSGITEKVPGGVDYFAGIEIKNQFATTMFEDPE